MNTIKLLNMDRLLYLAHNTIHITYNMIYKQQKPKALKCCFS